MTPFILAVPAGRHNSQQVDSITGAMRSPSVAVNKSTNGTDCSSSTPMKTKELRGASLWTGSSSPPTAFVAASPARMRNSSFGWRYLERDNISNQTQGCLWQTKKKNKGSPNQKENDYYSRQLVTAIISQLFILAFLLCLV